MYNIHIETLGFGGMKVSKSASAVAIESGLQGSC